MSVSSTTRLSRRRPKHPAMPETQRQPRASQIGAWASRQSEPVADRAALDAAYAEAEARFDGGDVPRPPHWGGYRLHPERVELWVGARGRAHDRAVWQRALRPDGEGWAGGAWTVGRLQP